MIPANIKTYLDIGGFIAFVVLVFILVHHLEQVGANKILAQDAAAEQAVHAKMLEQQTQMQAQADKAEAQRDATQQELDAFRSANPVGHVFVCHPNSPGSGLPKAPAANGSNVGTSSGPASVPEVSSGSTDIGSPLDTIVHAASVMGGLYRQYQQQPGSSAPVR